ncbi:hypothetical protein [Alteromonas ponticola]|uniref:Biliverdin-producing heme oxygenase n=1 Tax=Alteromonas ponticola TaxID=2720613 RepID=A0ABX1QZ26_9ALTE|nr:hypothetical protein [Alteromonas ponticola]NMH58748.1 biliverdin-producing heme oxygenase [Alteromonas ponticola]
MINTSFFDQIKGKTSNSHKHLEETYPFSTLMRSDEFDEQSYHQVLNVMAAFHQSINLFATSQLKGELATLLDTTTTCNALRLDINQLQQSFTPIICPTLDVTEDDTHSLLAYAYVWAGSSMGAQILIKWLQKNAPSLPTRYYQQMAAQSVNWPLVKALLSAQVEKPDVDSTSIIRCANTWFEAIIAHAQSYPAALAGDLRHVESL